MDGYELAARFSYITNALNYCGPHEGHKDFRQYMITHDPELKDKIALGVKRFEALYPYLKLIAEKTGLHYMDYKVIEAYWIGNELLDKFTKDDMNAMVRTLIKRGLPESLGEKLIQRMPEGAVPYHAFHVVYVGVGNVTGHVETTVQNMDNCRISVGKVLQTIDDKMIVATDTVRKEGERLYLSHGDTKTIVFDPKMLPSLSIGDFVAIHWGFASKKLDPREVGLIKKYTQLALDLANGAN